MSLPRPTNSRLDGLQGSQKPRISSVPEAATSAGDDATEYAASVGLHLDPWQAYVLRGALGESGELWSAFEVGLVVSRQNGKGGILEARELAGIELFGERLIIHTAHELKTAEDAFRRMVDICEASPDLDRQLKRVIRTNGKEAIEFKNGARIRYAARSKGSGRGWANAGLLVMDEAMFLDPAAMDALLPTLTTAENPQVWYTASAGLPESEHLAALRERALKGDDPSLAYFEWSAPDEIDLDDPEGWVLANPALGIRITEDFIRKERAALSDEGFARERLGIWSSGKTHAPIDPDVWLSLEDRDSKPGQKVEFAIDMPPNRSATSICAASYRKDKRIHVELVEHRKGTGWVVERARELVERHGGRVALDPSSPAGSLLNELEDAGVEVLQVSGREMAQACGQFYDAAVERGTIAHIGQPKLNVAVDAGRKRAMSDAWVWHRRDTSSDISPLVAVTLAHYAVAKPSKKKERSGKAAFV